MDSAIMAANEKHDYVLHDKITRSAYWGQQKAKWDLSNGLAGAREEGIEQGKIEIAQKMKTAGRPKTEIIEFTGLSPETIERL